ncbi:hypothetical protein LOZ65_006895 [Ophidiomyces ophidiicola]|nr:hypothetical protein LOZ65_006895 [Ophidiomyces ophidiicola]
MSNLPKFLVPQNQLSTTGSKLIAADISIAAETKPSDKALLTVSALVDSLSQCSVEGSSPSVWVDSCDILKGVIDLLPDLPVNPPSLYLDLEGVDLSRNGTVSILQIFVLPENRTYLIDIHILGKKAFLTPGSNGDTLKDILESSDIPKVFFDVRNDSDALYSHFDIHLSGVEDIQLMELATRTFSRRCVNGLSRCIERDGKLSFSEVRIWKSAKDKARKMFAPEHGGSYEVFNKRPISSEMKAYCIQDVQYMPRLWNIYYPKLTPSWAQKVKTETKNRVILSQSATFNGKGKHMALGPWTVSESGGKSGKGRGSRSGYY